MLLGTAVTYSVDFAIRETQIVGDSRQNQTVTLALDGNVAGTYASGPGLSTQFGSFIGTLTPSTSALSFEITSLRPQSFGVGWGQFFVDNVVVTQQPAPVPEPSTLVLMGFGLAGLDARRRKH